ncbi:hypothetical protein [Methylibium sp.]|jgi:cytochrome bd-type quinol oxidase subunit 2|uniref:hypothetical protein n=1 Tax=Methylibium sp. TaxID=2067992 RepID=UPI003D14983F
MLPLLRVLASEPDALVEHAAAYADLASDEWQQLQVHWAQRLLWLAIAAVAALAALMLGGVALMLWAALPSIESGRAWLLWAVPLVPGFVAACSVLAARRIDQRPAFGNLRAQLREDMALVREGLAP